MMLSARAEARVEARAGAGVEAAHTTVLHLPGAVLALPRAHCHRGAPLLKSMPMEKIHLCHAVFLHYRSVQPPAAQAVMARSKAC